MFSSFLCMADSVLCLCVMTAVVPRDVWCVVSGDGNTTTAGGGPDPLGWLRSGHDGCHRGYHTPVGRGRRGFTLGYLLDCSLGLLLHSRVYASSGVQVYYPWSVVSLVHSLYVPPAHHLRSHQP